MDDEIKEITIDDLDQDQEQPAEQVINPLDCVTITVKEYKKLIKKVERLKNKVEKEHNEMMIYWRQMGEAKDNLKEAQLQIQELLGLKDDKGDTNA